MNTPLITQLKEPKNRLKITGTLRFAYLDAAFLKVRGYYRLLPVGEWDAWQPFWDVWEMHKADLKAEGLSVRKEKGQWVIYYSPRKWSGIELDESIRGFEVLGDESTSDRQ